MRSRRGKTGFVEYARRSNQEGFPVFLDGSRFVRFVREYILVRQCSAVSVLGGFHEITTAVGPSGVSGRGVAYRVTGAMMSQPRRNKPFSVFIHHSIKQKTCIIAYRSISFPGSVVCY